MLLKPLVPERIIELLEGHETVEQRSWVAGFLLELRLHLRHGRVVHRDEADEGFHLVQPFVLQGHKSPKK